VKMHDDVAIRGVIDVYLSAYERHDASGCAAVYTNGAIMLSPWSAPARGRAAISDAHAEWFEEGETNKSMTVADICVQGNLGICLLHFAADVTDISTGEIARIFGASLSAMTKQTDGTWKISHQSLNGLEAGTTGLEQ
jgi:uncharacterized protein (TIGR02246 family)